MVITFQNLKENSFQYAIFFGYEYLVNFLGFYFELFLGLRKDQLIKWVKISHSFLQSVSNQFHVIILSLPM